MACISDSSGPNVWLKNSSDLCDGVFCVVEGLFNVYYEWPSNYLKETFIGSHDVIEVVVLFLGEGSNIWNESATSILKTLQC